MACDTPTLDASNPTAPGTTRALWYSGRGEATLSIEPVRPPSAGEVLVRTRYSALSRGTELLVLRGRVPKSQWQAMRCPLQEGDFPGPVKYGYMVTGEIVDSREPALSPGQRVFALAPHQDWLTLPAAMVVPVPEAVPDRRAVLAANLETALNGFWDGTPGPGDRVAVIGAGVVGCMLARLLAALPATETTLVDVDPQKAAIAEAMGVRFATPAAAPPDLDRVFHCSGNPDGLVTALGLCGPEATVVEMSWFGDRPASLPLGADFHARRLTIKSSQVGQLPVDRRPRWDHRRRLSTALDILADPAFDRLISHEVPFDDLPHTLAEISESRLNPLALLIDHR